MKQKSITLIAWFTGVSLILVGIAHFLFPFKFAAVIPPYLPFPIFLVLLSGWIEIFLGTGILYKNTRPLCALGYLILLLAVFPANIYVAVENGAPMNISPEIAWGRLPFQAVFFVFAWILKKEE